MSGKWYFEIEVSNFSAKDDEDYESKTHKIKKAIEKIDPDCEVNIGVGYDEE